MASITFVYVHCKPNDTFIAETLNNARNSVTEAGNNRFDVCQDREDPNKFVLVEIYGDETGPAQHKETDHYKQWRQNVNDLMAEPRAAVKYNSLTSASYDLPAEYKGSSAYSEPNSIELQIAHVFVTCKAGTEEQFIAATLKNANASVQEKDNCRFDVFQNASDSTKFLLLEVYATPEGPVHHKTTAHYNEWRETVADMMAVPRTAQKLINLFPASPSGFVSKAKKNTFGCPCITLNDGWLHPIIGYGTYKVGVIPASASAVQAGTETSVQASQNIADIIGNALDLGYRLLDCAEFYGNEKDVGEAIKTKNIDRSTLYLISKVWNTTIYQGSTAIINQVQKTLNDLQTDYLDLYLIHWPVPNGKHIEAYVTLQELVKKGVIRSLGLSNYTIEDYKDLMSDTRVSIKPTVNQIEVNPFLYRKNTIDFFQKNGVAIQAYRPLDQGRSMESKIILSIADKYNKTPAQILGRFCIQKGIMYIPKSVKRTRMEENKQVFDFSLDTTDMETLSQQTLISKFEIFKNLYIKCVVRDTPLEKDAAGSNIKTTFTVD